MCNCGKAQITPAISKVVPEVADGNVVAWWNTLTPWAVSWAGQSGQTYLRSTPGFMEMAQGDAEFWANYGEVGILGTHDLPARLQPEMEVA